MRDLPKGLLAAALLVCWSCSAAVPLENSQPSSDTLASALLEAMARKDRPRLEQLALTEGEFRAHVWPQLPSSRPERNLPFSYVWGDLHQKSGLSLSETLTVHGGHVYRLRRIRFKGITEYNGFRVHREATLDVTDAAGVERSVRVCGAFLEKDGVWKVFSYVVDD